MLILSDTLKQNIVKILEATRSLRKVAAKHSELPEGQVQSIAYACVEIAFSAMVAAGELEGLKNQDNILIQKEVVSCLNQIAAICLDVQDGQKSEAVRAQLLSLCAPCAYIARNVGIPELALDTELGIAPLDPSAIPTSLVLLAEEDNQDQIQKLKAEIAALREILTSLIIERDHLLNVVCPEIEAAYLRELGILEVEVFRARYEARLLKRTLELMRASVNRGEPVNVDTILETVREEEAQYRAFCDELYEKAAAAAAIGEELTAQRKAESEPAQEELDETALCKKLYRKIVKAMHPDLHPNQDEATRDLFKKANVAYEQGDLKTLQEIASMLDGETPEDTEQILETLRKEKEQLLEMIRAIREEIAEIKRRYPYTKKELLDDSERLAKEKGRLQRELQREKQAAARYKKLILEMEEQWKT